MSREDRQREFTEASGGPAFPVNLGLHDNQCNGISMLDYFADSAMKAIVAKTPLLAVKGKDDVIVPPDAMLVTSQERNIIIKAIAFGAYEQAAAMLAEREKRMAARSA